MINLLKPILAGRRLLILGYGREGQSTLGFIRKHFPDLPLGIADFNPGLEGEFSDLIKDGNIRLHLGPDYMESLPDYSLIIKSPGVKLPEPLNTAPGAVITSQTRLILQAFHRQVIGITGTKGKSTTSSLIHHLLTSSGLPGILVGNIGIPPFDHLDKAQPGTRIVFEMSSHQLEDIVLAPRIAVLLNLFPEHLDRYPSLEDYYSAKMRILGRQEEGDVFIYNEDIPGISERIKEINPVRQFFSFSEGLHVRNGCFLEDNAIMLSENGHATQYVEVTDDFPLKGVHNRMNMMAAILAARQAGAGDSGIKKGLATFSGLEHRLEYAGCFAGIHFYNDSIATIPEATIAAVKTLPETDTLILGGFDRMLDYTALIHFLLASTVRNFIFLGKAGERMLEGFRALDNGSKKLLPAASMQEAIAMAVKHTRKSKICLLSPAAASYDSFKNFEERGRVFKRLASAY
jgi:UDP-N-acetylmuramoylalanine--D-glutamate ligase